MTLWYYSKMGIQQGPVPEDELRTKIRRGEIGGLNLVWREGMADWLPLAQVSELMGTQETQVTPAEAVKPEPVIPPPSIAPPRYSMERPSPSFPVRQMPGNVPLPQPPAYHGNYVAPKIPNYMWQSVVATVIGLPFCCLLAMPFGIVAIVFASKVEGFRVQGNILEATAASNKAKNWMIASYACSAFGVLLQAFNLLVKSN
jgi:hypothetical protein